MSTSVNKYTNITPVEIAKLHLNNKTVSLEHMTVCKMKDYAMALSETLFNAKIFSNTGKNFGTDNTVIEDAAITINSNLLNSRIVEIKAENVTIAFILKLKKIATRYRVINAELFLYYLLNLFKETKQSFTVSFLLGVEKYEFEFDYNFEESQLYIQRESDTITFTEVDTATGIIRELATINNINEEDNVINYSLSSFLEGYGCHAVESIVKNFTFLANVLDKAFCLKNIASTKYSVNHLINKGFTNLVYYVDCIVVLPDNCESFSICELSYKDDQYTENCSDSTFATLDEILNFYNNYDFSTNAHILKLTDIPEHVKTTITNELKHICKEDVKLIIIE